MSSDEPKADEAGVAELTDDFDESLRHPAVAKISAAEVALRGLVDPMNEMAGAMNRYSALLDRQTAMINQGVKRGRGSVALLASNLQMAKALPPLVDDVDKTTSAYLAAVAEAIPLVRGALEAISLDADLRENARAFVELASLGSIAIFGRPPSDLELETPVVDRSGEPPKLRALGNRIDELAKLRQRAVAEMAAVHEEASLILYEIDASS